MKRRGFLGFMGGAAVAGPQMARAAAEEAAKQLAGVGTIGLESAVGSQWEVGVENAATSYRLGTFDRIAKLKDKIDLLTTSWDDRMSRALREVSVNHLDPDLAVNRSMSLSAKMAIQKKRNALRSLETERYWLTERLGRLMRGEDEYQ